MILEMRPRREYHDTPSSDGNIVYSIPSHFDRTPFPPAITNPRRGELSIQAGIDEDQLGWAGNYTISISRRSRQPSQAWPVLLSLTAVLVYIIIIFFGSFSAKRIYKIIKYLRFASIRDVFPAR